MPYITDDDRRAIQFKVGELSHILREQGCNEGHINYAIFTLLVKTLGLKDSPAYKKFNMVDGILAQVGREVYRRLGAPYEDQKMKENGDVI